MKKQFLYGIPIVCLVFLLWTNGNSSHNKTSVVSLIGKEIANEAVNKILPFFYYMGNDKGRIERVWQEEMSRLLPFLCLEKGTGVSTRLREDVISLEEINVERISMEKLLVDNAGDILREMERENQMIVREMEAELPGKAIKKQFSISLESLSEYTELLRSFYTIDAAAQIGEDRLNALVLGEMDLTIEKNQKEPQILIYHTHSQEGFIDSVPGDDSTTIMGVGKHLASILQEEYGYQVLYHDGKYDVESRDSAYARSLPEIQQLIKDYPSIEVVIDLHRDAVADINNKYVMDWQGKPTARFMYFNGVSRTRKNGEISYLYNENLDANLAFSFQMKRRAEEYYPGLTRKNYIHAYRYNMHLLPRYTLLELGAQNNTLEEAMNACDPIAHILDMVLSGEES